MLVWEKGNPSLTWNNRQIDISRGVSSACELPNERGLCITTMIAETPSSESNALLKQNVDQPFQQIRILDRGHPVQFLACVTRDDKLVLRGSNETDYVLNPETLEVVNSSYYR